MKTLKLIAGLLLAVALLMPPGVRGTAAAQPGLVPLRAVAEAAGAKVDWEGSTQTVTVTRNDVTLVVRIGESHGTLNGTGVFPVGTTVVLENSRTMIPLDFLRAMLGVQVEWDATAGVAVVDEQATRAMDFMRALTQGKADAGSFTPALREALPPEKLVPVAAQLKALGGMLQMSMVGRTRNAVHENVRFVAAFLSQALDVTVRFDANGLIDDYFMTAYAAPVNVAGPPPYANPAAFTEQDLVIGEGTPFPLPATLALPTGTGPFPALVLVHGSGPNDRDESVSGVKVFRDLAQGLAARGIAVLRYEKRTREHSQKFMAGPSVTIHEETVADAVLAAALLSKHEQIDPKRIFVLGHSQGGYAVPRIIAQDSDKLIAGAVIAAGPDSFLDILVEQNKLMVEANLLPEAQLAFVQHQVGMLRDPGFNPAAPPPGYALGLPYYWYDLIEPASVLAKEQTTPLLVFQGARDFQVPVSQFERWQAALSGRQGVTFKLYPKLNHVFTEGDGPLGFLPEYEKPANVPVYVIDDIAAWIQGW
ncbi:MAG TPA: alpha/beta fold hydrolase [Symbiobacteriaceae bacterium]|nr:alpha/beta fold hydrolase [Symbiobacteriaceae bacterium]